MGDSTGGNNTGGNNTSGGFTLPEKRPGRKPGGSNKNGGRRKKLIAGQTRMERYQFGPTANIESNASSSSTDTDNHRTSDMTEEVQEADDDDNLVSGLGTLMQEFEVSDMEIQCDGDTSHSEDDQNIEDDTTYSEPPILVEYFRKIKDDIIKECKNKGGPQVYIDRKTFWIEPPAPYFSLYTGQADPKELYYPRIFLWQPHRLSLSKDLVCPNPKCTGRKLNSKGYNDAPYARRVVDLDR
ncbi:hypothetical protein BJV82DRAFT_583751 [Fennellomyces sp. T-0311]|nr:hypothetical protein BJV82DRAFT_583751 [Fennellomyces sp. T-0311]